MSEVPLIAHVVYRFDVGGLENGVVNLINRIPEDRYRHLVIALTEYTDFRRRLRREIPLYALHKRPGYDLALYRRLWRLLRRLRPDIIHTRNLNALEAQLPAWLAGVPGRVHGEHGWDVHDLDGASRKYCAWRKLFRPFVHRYVPLSCHLADYLRDRVGVPEERIERICNGVDSDRFRPDPAGRRDLPVPGFARVDSFVIGTVGRMESVKDQTTLARAFVQLVQDSGAEGARLRLVMIGDGSLRPEVERILGEAGLLGQAWLPGGRDDVAALMRGFDVFVLPSLNEGISNTILEAMASGLPTVATSVGGNGELVQEGETGFLVPRSDPPAMAAALRRYWTNASLRRVHGQAARERVEREFSLAVMVEKYTAVYDRLVSDSGRHPRLRQWSPGRI